MYGTVFHMRPKTGNAEKLATMFDQWWDAESARVRGVVSSYLFVKDSNPDELIGVAVFANRQTYFDNANSAKQDAYYHRMRELLEEDPVWEDGSVVSDGLLLSQPIDQTVGLSGR